MSPALSGAASGNSFFLQLAVDFIPLCKTCEGGLDIAFKNLVYDIYSRDLSKKVRESRRQGWTAKAERTAGAGRTALRLTESGKISYNVLTAHSLRMHSILKPG